MRSLLIPALNYVLCHLLLCVALWPQGGNNLPIYHGYLLKGENLERETKTIMARMRDGAGHEFLFLVVL